MARIVLRKLTSRGDDSATVESEALPDLLTQEFGRGFQAAVKSDVGEARFIGNRQARVVREVESEIRRGAKEVQVLLVPRVSGG